ncbi:MAG TPA: RecX family transcriptional regulator, partial [Bacteroidales bacterium]|nr:RecX family transcriptional regulator [Bacteroidales bacterium]
MKRTDLNPDEISGIVEKLRAENYLNEARYAASFARDKFRFNKWGKNKIAFELG